MKQNARNRIVEALPRLLGFGRNLHLLGRTTAKHHVLRPEKDVAIDLQVGTSVALHATVASVLVNLCERDLVAGHRGRVGGADRHAKGWQLCVARIYVAAGLCIVLSALYFAVVGLSDGWIYKNQ